jgi:hypothetical protein
MPAAVLDSGDAVPQAWEISIADRAALQALIDVGA